MHGKLGNEFELAPGLVMDREDWPAAVRDVAESWTQLVSELN